MTKLLVFDWDGTIANSIDPIYKLKVELARQFQLGAPSLEQVKAALGQDIHKAFGHCYPKAHPEQIQKLITAFKQQYLTPPYTEPLFANCFDTLKKLKQKATLTIATSKPREQLEKSMHELKLNALFSASICAGETKAKPHPDMLQKLMKEFDCQTHDTIMVGDSLHDLEMSRQAQVHFIAVGFGSTTEQQFAKAQQKRVAHDWPALYNEIQQR